MTGLSNDDRRDALAYLLATYRGDEAGRDAIAAGCDPAGLVDGLTVYTLHLLSAVHADPAAHLTRMLDGLRGDQQ